jgi:hypothetical protein
MATLPEPQNVVYGLYDARTPDRIRYVGMTTRGLSQRLKYHRLHANYTANAKWPVNRWKRKIGDNLAGRVLVICDSRETAWAVEIDYIAAYKGIGQADLNIHPGGSGGTFADQSGERNPGSILDAATVELIYLAVLGGRTTASVAEEVGVSLGAVSGIATGVNWKHLGLVERYGPVVRNYSVAGSDNPHAKLTKEDVQKIRALYDSGVKIRDILPLYSVSRTSISNIVNRVTWPGV